MYVLSYMHICIWECVLSSEDASIPTLVHVESVVFYCLSPLPHRTLLSLILLPL